MSSPDEPGSGPNHEPATVGQVMSPTQALRSVFTNYFNFSGRACRREFWWWFCWYFGWSIGMIVLSLLIAASGSDALLSFWMLAWIIVGWATLIPNLAVMVRRMHDQGRSGWWYLVVFVPGVGFLLLIAFMVPDSEPHPNRWGPPPAGSAYADPRTWEPPEVI